MHLLKSLGSIPGRALMRRGSMCVGPSGNLWPPATRLRATLIIQLRVAVSWWGSVRVSMAGYVLKWEQEKRVPIIYHIYVICQAHNQFIVSILNSQWFVNKLNSTKHLWNFCTLKTVHAKCISLYINKHTLTSPALEEWLAQVWAELGFAGPGQHPGCQFC